MGNQDFKKAAAHYKGLAAGAKRMQQMGHTTASGGSNKPPKRGCGKKTAQVVVLFTSIGLSAFAVLVDRWI